MSNLQHSRWLAVRGLVVAASFCTLSAPAAAQSDICGDATSIGLDERIAGNTNGLTSSGAATCGSSSASPDAWFSYTAAADAFIVASTCGSSFDTVLSVHSACADPIASEIACNDDACSFQSTLGFDAAAGQTYLLRVSGFSGDSGAYVLELTERMLPKGDGADLVPTNIEDLSQMGRLGSTIALSFRSTICNVGSEPIDWFANPNPRHPFLVYNVYRLRDDRLEQIGQSWVKHGFSASQGDACGLGCIPIGGSSQLGVGCADVYGTGTNANQRTFGPRTEINPWTGTYVFPGSHLDVNSGDTHNEIEHRLQVTDADIAPASNPGALFYIELYVLSHDDVERTNSVGHKRFIPVGSPGGRWNFNLQGGGSTVAPILDVWSGATRTAIPAEPESDGRCLLAAKATDNGDGAWRYEYALFNLDMDRGIASFAVPVPESTTVSDTTFHTVRSEAEGFGNQDWTVERSAGALTWSTAESGEDPANPLRWGTLANFGFTADAGPTDVEVTLGCFKPGAPAAHLGMTIGPSAVPVIEFVRGDCDGDGNILGTVNDAIYLFRYNFSGGPAPLCLAACDIDGNGRVSGGVNDGIQLLRFNFTGGPAPVGPYPMCGPGSLASDKVLGCKNPTGKCL